MSTRYDSQIDLTLPNNTHTSIVLLVGEGMRVLELGASSGYMTAAFKNRGCEVVAVELDQNAAEDLAAVADLAVIGDLQDPTVLDKVGRDFDVVVAGDVLEHLTDPAAVLAAAVDKLTPDGAVVLSVPNVGHVDLRLSLLHGRFEYRKTGLMDETHVRFFTYESLLELLAGAGLRPVDLVRIVVPAFETELGVDRGSFPDAVIAEALKVPESQTYQFVVKAVRDDGDPVLQAASADMLRNSRAALVEDVRAWEAEAAAAVPLREQLQQTRTHLHVATEARTVEMAQLAQVHTALDVAQADIEGLRAELRVARSELLAAAIEESQRYAAGSARDRMAATLATRTHERNLAAGELAERDHELVVVRVELSAAYRELEAIRERERTCRAAVSEENDVRPLPVIISEFAAGAQANRRRLDEVLRSRSFRWGNRVARLIRRIVPAR